MTVVTCIEDLRRLAKHRVPRAFFDYVESGAYDERTLAANRSDLDAVLLQQRVLRGVEHRDPSADVLGERCALPLLLAPTGLTGLVYPNGELHACRAAHAFGIPYTLSTVSIASIEDVSAVVGKPFWFQLYMMRDRGFVEDLLQRAATAGCTTLMITVDLPVHGQRHADVRNGLSVPPRLALRNLVDMASKPRWVLGMFKSRRRHFGNLEGRVDGMHGVQSMAEWVASQYDPSLTWRDVDWLRARWSGKLVIKGIMAPADARIACEHDVQALIVSNHGGRQLDGTSSTIRALPSVVDAVADRLDVFVDGGVRSGADILRMVDAGAKAVGIGRPFLYGLGALGEAGVTRCLEILARELDVAMALTGRTRLFPDGSAAADAPEADAATATETGTGTAAAPHERRSA